MSAPSVAEALLDILAEAGVRHIFGIPGDAINALVDAIRKQDVIEFIQVRHEETGALAASAQAKLTGRLAACVGTAGPGAIHLLNGLYDAKLDHAPVVAVTGQIESDLVGTEYHQEVDLYTLFKDVAVANHVIMTSAQMPHVAVHACQAAIAGRGVAHLSLPVDVAGQHVPEPNRRHAVFTGEALIAPCDDDLERAAEILNSAERVAILAGIGARHASSELVDLADKLGAPIVKSLRAKEILPDDHPHVVGGLGLLGTKPGMKAMEECNALLLVGTDFPYHDFYPGGVPAVQIDIDPTRLGKRYPVTTALRGHARLALPALSSRITRKEDRKYLSACQEAMREWFEEMEAIEHSGDTPIHPQSVARKVGDLAADDAIFVCDTGAVTVWGARNLRLRGRQRFTLSSSLASMAFALPGAIGAQLAYPERQVIALAGDGGFGMLLGDFLTAVKYELPITIVVFNNRKLGLIQMEQEVMGFPEYQTGLQDLDFGAFARLAGGDGIRVTHPTDLDDALRTAFASERPFVVDVEINPEERTTPPKILARQALGYGIAKAKEFFGKGDKAGGPSVIRDALP